ncbi:type II toxin-antitoxin system antitoxin SocA domain-containing protein [Spirillospora sp. NPDC049024]|uniref:type II toxin-antitoxin system antitoxin SocA domain-containing protein n=1 Tax=Actinomadura sp. NPDC000600 TaxID=3154262 RepID=UPI00339392CC
MTAPAPLRGPAAAIAYLLASARAHGMRVNRTKLTKLLYLADLRAVEHGLPPGSGVEWRWRHYGPHSLRLKEIERDLQDAGHVQVEGTVDPFTGNCEYTIHLMDAPQTVVDAAFTRIVDSVLDDFGDWSASQLRDLTYQTPPMQEAAKRGKREVRLDLSGGAPFPDLGPGLAHLRDWAARNPLPADEPGGTDDLAEELDDLAEHRADATRRYLDE